MKKASEEYIKIKDKYDKDVIELEKNIRGFYSKKNRFVSDEKVKFMIFQNLGPRPTIDGYANKRRRY